MARERGLTYVVQISQAPTETPDSVMTAFKRSVVYSDPRADITEDVLRLLNEQVEAKSK